MSNFDREIGSNVGDDPNEDGIPADVTTPRSDEVHPVEPTNRPADDGSSGISTSPTDAGDRPDADLDEDDEDE